MKYKKSGKIIRGLFVVAFLWGIPMIVFPCSVIYARLKIEVEGKIIERKPGHVPGYPHRELTDYKILRKDGTTFEYRSYGNDSQLSRKMPVGAYVIKKKGDINYTVDGHKYDDFPTLPYAVTGVIGFSIFTFGIVIGILLIRKEFKPP